MTFYPRTQFNSWAQNKGIFEPGDGTDYGMFWQFRMSILPTEDNLNKAFNVISQFEPLNEKDDKNNFICPNAKLIQLNSNNMNEWDGTLMDASDRDQRGKELCVYLPYDERTGSFLFSEEYIKHLMLDLWKALEYAGVELSYITPTNEEKEIPSDSSILTPFTYSSFKPYKSEDGILHSNDYNPMNHPDPLKDLYISRADLDAKGIKKYDALEISNARINYMKDHYQKACIRFNRQILSLQLTHSSYLDKDKHISALSDNDKLTKNILDDISNNIFLYFPSTFVEGKRSSLFDIVIINKLFEQDILNKASLKKYLTTIRNNAQKIIENLLVTLQAMDWPIAKLDDEIITQLVKNHPREMQSLQRQFIHLEHENQAIIKEQTRYNCIEANKPEVNDLASEEQTHHNILEIENTTKKEPLKNNELKLKNIAKTVLKAATIGSTIGTLFGVGIGATLVATGIFAPLGAGVLGVLAVSATIGLASSILGALFVGLTSLLIETIRYKANAVSIKNKLADSDAQHITGSSASIINKLESNPTSASSFSSLYNFELDFDSKERPIESDTEESDDDFIDNPLFTNR